MRGLLASARLLTLIGAGGVGKTRLAMQVAAEQAETTPRPASGCGIDDHVHR